MAVNSAAPGLSLREEGARCKASLEAFTENLITKLAVSKPEAEQLCKYDRSRRDGNMYLHFPFCFLDAFPGVPIEAVRIVALSAVLWMSYMRAQDDAVDKNRASAPILLFLRDLYLRESLRLLYTIFVPNSKFWDSYSAYFDEYAYAVLCECRKHSSIESHYPEEEFCAIAKGKAAMAKYPLAALAELSGHHENVALLTESLDCFHVGYQYWDDVVDWKEDLASSKYSLLLTRAFEGMENREGSPDELRERIGHAVYYSGLAEANLEESNRWLERAYDLSIEARCTVWANYLKRLQKQAAVLADDLRLIMTKDTL